MKLAQAQAIAERLRSELAPACERIEIAGSIRRQRPDVGDIELVAIPKVVMIQGDLFGGAEYPVVSPEFCRLVEHTGKHVKGLPTKRYTQRELPEGIKLDLFLCDSRNWGLIFAIRTGSARFSHEVLACGWARAGYHSETGRLRVRTPWGMGRIVELPEEADLFRVCKLDWVNPENRE